MIHHIESSLLEAQVALANLLQNQPALQEVARAAPAGPPGTGGLGHQRRQSHELRGQ
jgi:hypothetical protein